MGKRLLSPRIFCRTHSAGTHLPIHRIGQKLSFDLCLDYDVNYRDEPFLLQFLLKEFILAMNGGVFTLVALCVTRVRAVRAIAGAIYWEKIK